jgi:hypothetical protein
MNDVGTSIPSASSNSVTPATVPGAPFITSITPGNTQLTVNFTEPPDNGGAPITNYQYLLNGGSIWDTPSIPVPTTPLVITGLNGGDLYTVTLRAVNTKGPGAQSNTESGTPTGLGIKTFIANNTWIAPATVSSVEYLIVGGGGGGGGGYDTGGGGGGGGGMVLTGTTGVSPGISYIINVGNGGAASTNSYLGPPPVILETSGGDGTFSRISGSGLAPLTALGGGGGLGSRTQTGGSGRGGSAAVGSVTAATGGSGGGNAATSAGGSGGGGGGALTNGVNGIPGDGGDGGAGIVSSITGSSVMYGTGGAGARGNTGTTGANGLANRGNGGGGGGNGPGGARNGGAGGSGIVVLKYTV